MVKQWFIYAARDLKMAKHSLEFSSEYKNISGFHSQQCAEKSIKAFLSFHKIRFKKVHDFEKLSDYVGQVDKSLASLVLEHKDMIDLAIAYRYPDAELKPLTVARAKKEIKNAEKFYKLFYESIYGAR